MTTKLLNTYKQKIRGLNLIPDKGGCFELTVNGKLVYSKLKTGSFPNEDEILNTVGGLLR